MVFLVLYLKRVRSLHHIPVIVKKEQWLAQKVGGSSAQYLSCKVYHDWSIIKLLKNIVFIRPVYLCSTFDTKSHYFC